MEYIKSLNQLFETPVEEVISYFKTLKFRGIIVEVKDYTDTPLSWACGKIENISLNGDSNFLCPRGLYIPSTFKAKIKEGLCEFTAVPDKRGLSNDKPRYKLIIGSIRNIAENVRHRNIKEENTFRRNLKLKDSLFVGQFIRNIDGSYKICDIRRSDFSKLILQNGKPQNPIVYHPHRFNPHDGKYYEFTWILNKQREDYVYLFVVDETKPIKEIHPDDLIQRLHNDIMSYPAGAGQKIVKMLDTLKNQLTASGKEIFIYELLQNANDYPQTINGEKEPVDVEFRLTLSSLVFMHSGAVFNEQNIAAICSINDKEKDANKDAIGYKGIGFKTVFLDNDNVYIQTGGYSFRFDKQATKDIVDTPWQILPIITPYTDLSTAERAIFSHANEKFRVKIALNPIKPGTLRSYEQMFKEIFTNERVILFIPNLSSVKVYLQGTSTPDITCNRNSDKWRVDDFEENIEESVTDAINADIDEQEDSGSLKIPTKYYDFKRTKVSFACEIEGGSLKPVQDTSLYCYLPAKEAKWGLKFLMNTDMIPNGARDNIEVEFSNSINVNEEISRIAGSKLFDWIHKLCLTKLYDLNSIFALIPNFDSIRQGRDKFKNLISVFKEGFDSRVSEDELIPTDDGYAKLSQIVLDKTGITASSIVSDELFLKWIDKEDKLLPSKEARISKNVLSLIKTYIDEFDLQDNIFDKDSLHDLIENESFQEWLKVQENNNKFIQFLLDKDLLDDFSDELIFINEVGEDLACAEDLYYDIDKYLNDLQCFSNDYLSRLSVNTRNFFKQNKGFLEFASNNFCEFNSENFVSVLYNRNNKKATSETLSTKDNSLRFVHFLAIEEVKADELPLFNNQDELIDEQALIFFDKGNERGEEIRQMQWITSGMFDFLSEDYLRRDGEKVKTYLQEYCGVRKFSEDDVIKDIILDEDRIEVINDAIKNINASIEFVAFLEENMELIPKKTFNSSYKLFVTNNGETKFETIDGNTFFSTPLSTSYEELSWNDDWLYLLDEGYFDGLEEEQIKGRKEFFDKVFGVREITKEIFYNEFVHDQLGEVDTIITRDRDQNIEFWQWVVANVPTKAEELKELSILVNDWEGEESFKSPNSTYIYMSDTYMEEGNCIEDFVKEYISDSYFVSPDYIKGLSNSTIAKWRKFLTNLDISAEISKILIENIIPDLATIENDNLPALLMVNWSKLQEREKTYEDLSGLKLRCKDGNFYSLEDCCLINTGKEPFKCISLDNEYNLKQHGQTGWFITQIAEKNSIEVVSTTAEWGKQKIERLIQLQEDEELGKDIHFSFIKELADLESDDLTGMREKVKEIKLLTKNEEYCDVEDITLGHIYNPICDFEANGVEDLNYLSEDYKRLGINEKGLRTAFNIHRNFEKEDIRLLEDNPVFAKYIWHTYIKDTKQCEKLARYAEEGEFSNTPCLLSQAGEVCCPEDMYSNCIADYIKGRTGDWENKVVDTYLTTNCAELLKSLDLKQSLDFRDSLVALLYEHTKEERKLMFRYLCDGEYDEEAVSTFLEDERATWKNAKGEDFLIKNLYAISPKNERLLSYFRKNENILDVTYVNKTDFDEVCRILNITIIDDEDVEPKPVNGRQINLNYYWRQCLFVVSCLETEEWQERYKEYKEKIQDIKFYTCESINLEYRENNRISVNAQRFYTDENQIFFVGNWSDRKVYTEVVTAIHDILEFSIDIEKSKQLFDPDENFIDIIKEECKPLLEDDNFIRELKNTLPNVYDSLYPKKEVEPTATPSTQSVHEIEPTAQQKVEPQRETAEPENGNRVDAKTENEEWERAVCDYMGGGYQLPEDEIMAENIITRWRILVYLKENNTRYTISSTFGEDEQKKYIKGDSIIIPLANGKNLLAQGAKGGLWHISPNVWRGIEENELVVCLCVGNEEEDFKFAETLEDIENCADTPNVLVKVAPKGSYTMMESIQTVFPGANNYKMNIHLMVKIHSTRNKNLDSIFDVAFDAPQDDYEF